MPAQKPVRKTSATPPVGYFGPEGSFSHEVTRAMIPDEPLEAFTPTAQGFRLLEQGKLARIVVPFENSIGGAVPETLDQLLLAPLAPDNFAILEQWVYKINLCLLGRPGLETRNALRLYSHFVPLQVVRPWLEKNLPKIETVLTSSTSAAAREAARDPRGLAVANAGAASVYGLRIISQRLAPPDINITRFLLIGPQSTTAVLPTRTARNQRALQNLPRRAMAHLLLKNRPGALADVLNVLKQQKINLTQILSRPVPGKPGEHQFLIEWETKGSHNSTLDALKHFTQSVRILGAYVVREVRRKT